MSAQAPALVLGCLLAGWEVTSLRVVQHLTSHSAGETIGAKWKWRESPLPSRWGQALTFSDSFLPFLPLCRWWQKS